MQALLLHWGRRTAKHRSQGVAEPGAKFISADLQYPPFQQPKLTDRSALALTQCAGQASGSRYLVPWGLAHMPYLATQLQAQGYQGQWLPPVLFLDVEQMATHFLMGSGIWTPPRRAPG
uniref:Uncharacterized protein n=1 Tax=Eutreptiella gymnastica TaxID=73025 RepID=A0A7S1IXF5_9EUGL